MQINFESNINQLRGIYKDISKSLVPKAAQQALNKTVKGVKTDAVKALAKETAVKQKLIRDNLIVKLSKKYSLSASVDSSKSRAKNLINYVSASQRKPGYFNSRKTLKSGKLGKYKARGVKAKAWGKSKVYAGTFIGTGRNNNTLVFARKQGSKKLKAIVGPSPRTFFMSPKQKLANSRSASKRFSVEIKRAINYQLSKIKSPK